MDDSKKIMITSTVEIIDDEKCSITIDPINKTIDSNNYNVILKPKIMNLEGYTDTSEEDIDGNIYTYNCHEIKIEDSNCLILLNLTFQNVAELTVSDNIKYSFIRIIILTDDDGHEKYYSNVKIFYNDNDYVLLERKGDMIEFLYSNGSFIPLKSIKI